MAGNGGEVVEFGMRGCYGSKERTVGTLLAATPLGYGHRRMTGDEVRRRRLQMNMVEMIPEAIERLERCPRISNSLAL